MLDRIPWDETGLIVVFDYETSGLHPDDGARPSTLGIKWGHSSDEQLCIPVDQGVLDKPGTQPTLFGDAPNVSVRDWRKVHEWLLQQRLVAHNAKADLWFAWAGLRAAPIGERTCYDLSSAYYWDTMVAEALLHPGERVSLDVAAGRRGWNGPYQPHDQRMRAWALKNKHKGQVRYDLAPWDILAPYLAGDLERTWALFHDQQQPIEEGLIPRSLLWRELEMVRTLFRMEQRGLPYRVKESLKAASGCDAEMRAIQHDLPFDPSTQAEVVAWLRDSGVKLHKTEKGAWSVDQAAVNRAIDLDVPYAQEYQRWVKLQTARGLWYLGWAAKAGADKRVRAEYRQVKTWEGNSSNGTVSGRFAVSRVQVQAIPGGRQIPTGYPTMQELIRPEPPNQLFEIDLSQAEMRVAASIAKCTPMLDGFNRGLDAHDSTTQLIWNIDKQHDLWDARRQVAKRLGFGVIYGAGIRTLAEQIKLFTGQDLGEAGVRELWDQYRDAFPQLFAASRNIQRSVEKNGFLILPGGKVRKFQVTESLHKAFNAMIQGGVAAAMLEAMNLIEKHYPGVMVGQVHDSVMIETPDPYVPEGVAEVISSVFEHWYPGCAFPTNVKNFADKK